MSDIRKKLSLKKTKLATTREVIKDHPAILGDMQDGNFYQVELKSVHPDPEQPRKHFDKKALNDLANSIKQKGVLQPVIIRRGDDKKIYLVAGERRFRAAHLAGLEKIPAIFSTGNPREISLIENLQRENLNAVEEAEALEKMIQEYGYNQTQLATIIGKGRTTINEALSLTKLPEEIKQECRRADTYPRRLLIEIAKQENPKKMISLFNKIKEQNLKSEQVRDITRKKTENSSPSVEIIKRVYGLTKKLQEIDIDDLEKSERAELIKELSNLRILLEDYI